MQCEFPIIGFLLNAIHGFEYKVQWNETYYDIIDFKIIERSINMKLHQLWANIEVNYIKIKWVIKI